MIFLTCLYQSVGNFKRSGGPVWFHRAHVGHQKGNNISQPCSDPRSLLQDCTIRTSWKDDSRSDTKAERERSAGPIWFHQQGNTISKHASIRDTSSQNAESSDILTVKQEVKHAAIPDTCSQNTESSDILIVKQGMLIQHLEEKVSEMKQKLRRMDQVIHELEYQETLTMLSVAKVHTCGLYIYINKTTVFLRR